MGRGRKKGYISPFKGITRLRNEILYDDFGIIVAMDNQGRTFLIDSIDRNVLDKYWTSHNGYFRTSGKERLERTILNYDSKIDHIDLDTTNNCRLNLRICTHGQNRANSKVQKNKCGRFPSKFKGVQYFPGKKTTHVSHWLVYVRKDKKLHYGGCFEFSDKGEEQAARAADKLGMQLHSEFYRPNFPNI